MQPVLKRSKTAPTSASIWTSSSLESQDPAFEDDVSPENLSSLPIPDLNLCSNLLLDDLQGRNGMRPSTEKLRCCRVKSMTALAVLIDGFEALYEDASTKQIGEATSELYEQIEQAAQAYGVQVIERRNDRFVFMATDLTTPTTTAMDIDEGPFGGGDRSESIQRLLALAVDLQRRLPATEALRSPTASITPELKMGMASGAASLLCAGQQGDGATRSTLGVRGDAAHTASAVAGLAAAGTVAVDGSALWRWAAAARLLPPPSWEMECEDGERRRSAIFDLRTCAFEPSTPPPAAERGAAVHPHSGARGAGRLRRAVSLP